MSSYSAGARNGRLPLRLPQFPVNLEHVLGFTSISNSAVAQNHSTIAYAAGSTTILYNKDTLKQDFIINRVRKTITSISLSPDGQYLATGESGHDPKIRIWDLAGDRKSCVELGDHRFAIDSVCFSTKTGCLVSIGSINDGYICVWNWQDETKLASNKCLVSIRRIAFAEDGSRFVTVGDRHVKFWNIIISKTTHGASPLRGNEPILGEHKTNCFTDVVCGRGSCADLTWTLSTNGLICQFDKDRKLLAHKNLQKKANCLAIGNSNLVVGCDKGVVYILSLQTLEPTMSIPLPHCLGVDISFFTSTNQTKSPQQPNISFPNVIAVCLDEVKSLLTCFYNDHSFYIWDIKNIQSIEKRDAHMYHSECGWAIETYSRTSQSSSSLGQLSLITSSSDNTIRFWSLNHDEANSYSASSQTGNSVNDKLMKVIYLDEDHPKEKPSESAVKVGGRCMKMSPDGLSLVIGGLNGNIRVFDMETFKQTVCIEAHDSEVLSVDFGHSIDMNVTFLASSGRDRFIHIFDASRNYQLIKTLADHTGVVTAVRFTLSSTTSKLGLISASADKSLIFRSISRNENGKYQFLRLHNIFEHQTFYDLAVDHQYKRIHTTCQDRITRVYNTEDGRRVQTWKDPTNDNAGYLIKIDIDASGRYLATSCSNKYVYLWDMKTPEYIASLCGHAEVVTDLKFSHDGRRLYTIATDSCVFVWKLGKSDSLSSSCQSISQALPKTDDHQTTEVSETMPQAPSVTGAHQPETECQQSLSAPPEVPPIQCETESINSQLTRITSEEIFGTMIGPKDNESVISNEDDDTNSNNIDSPNERASLFLIENDGPENPTIDTPVDDVDSKRHQFARQNSISSKFRQQSKEIGSSDTLLTEVNETENDGPTPIQTSESTISETVDDMETKAVPSVSSTNPKTSGDRLESEGLRHSSTSSLNNITENTVSSLSLSNVPSYTGQISDLETNQTKANLEQKQYTHSTSDLRTCIPNDNDNSLTEIKIQQSLPIPDLRKMQQEEVGSSTSVADSTINDAKQGDSMNHGRMSIVNDLANELFKCLDELDNLYQAVTKILDTQDTILRESIERTYCDLRRRITNNQQQQNEES